MMSRILNALGTLLLAACLLLTSVTVSAPEPVPVATVPPVTSARTISAPAVTTVEPGPEEVGEPVPTHTLTDVREMSVGTDGIISPPDFDHVFRVHGLPDGPVWLAAHARSAGREPAPGNAFLTFAVGDRIEALGTAWRVTERWTASKDAAESQGPLHDPDRYRGDLILVSCLPRSGGAATSNTWFVATPVTG